MKSAIVRLDERGHTITTAVVYEVALQLREMTVGGVLELLTDDFEPFYADITAWCRATGHRLLSTDTTESGICFTIEKREMDGPSSKVAMIVSADGLEELLSPLAFALAAALEGDEVHIYFQGPAVRVLSKRYRPRLSGWARPFSRIAAARMAAAGHHRPQDKIHQLRTLGARLYVCAGSIEHFRVGRNDLIFPDLPLVEYLTFMRVMAEADVQLYT